MGHLPEHACEHGAFAVLGSAPDLAEAERAQRAAMALALADLTADLGDLDLRHLAVVLLPAQAAALRLLLRGSDALLDDRLLDIGNLVAAVFDGNLLARRPLRLLLRGSDVLLDDCATRLSYGHSDGRAHIVRNHLLGCRPRALGQRQRPL